MASCHCIVDSPLKLIVLTGGPGAGKTAVIELARKYFCKNLKLVPEAASIVFGGGFPRKEDAFSKMAAQRVIVKVQQELELLVTAQSPKCNFALCDRGTLDGLAYWPEEESTFFRETGLDKQKELLRYHAVIHLHSPSEDNGFNNDNPSRIETAKEALQIDSRILNVWKTHPRHYVIPSTKNFFEKAARTLEIISSVLSGIRHPDENLQNTFERSRT